MEVKWENETKFKYLNFKNHMVEKGMENLQKELHAQYEIRKTVNWNIKQLKSMINES